MPWNSLSPDGSKSVKQNTTPMQQNTSFTEVEMNKDHFWNAGIDQNGHHRFAQMEATNDANKSLPTNAVLATAMDLVYFNRFKTPGETGSPGSPNPLSENSQPFVISQGANAPFDQKILQLLGIRACAVFNLSLTNPFPLTVVYHHNLSTITKTASSPFIFTATFDIALPTANYLVFGGGMGATGSGYANFQMGTGNTLAPAKTIAQTIFGFFNSSNPPLTILPIQGWIMMFGG